MSDETKTVIETKTVEKVEVNLDEIFNGAPGAESIVLPDDETKKPNVFSRKKDLDMSFMDDTPAQTKKLKKLNQTVAESAKKEEVINTEIRIKFLKKKLVKS